MNLHLYPFRFRDRVKIFITSGPLGRFLFGQKRSLLFNSVLTRAVISYYDGDSGHQTDLSTGNLGYGFIHYALILNFKPRRILCIGSRKGYIPAICALACQENNLGHVDFVDAGYGNDDKNHWSGVGWWKLVNPDYHFSFLNLNQRLSTFVTTTGDFVHQHKNTVYDYIYIDGDHSYKGVLRDYNLFWPRLSKNGLMIFHDIAVHETKELGKFGVWRLWKKIGLNHGVQLLSPQHSGLGIIQKTQ